MPLTASDKPDPRVPLELADLADPMAKVEFKVFAGPANDPNGRVVALQCRAVATSSAK